MKKLFWTLAITGALGAYAYSKRDAILKYLTKKMIELDETVEQTKNYVSKLEAVKNNVDRFLAELDAKKPVIDELTEDINKYNQEIEQIVKKLQDEQLQ